MQSFYFTKQDMFGIKRGHVEMFQEHAAVQHLREGTIEPFDANRKEHAEAPGAKDAFAHYLAAGVEIKRPGAQPLRTKA